MQSRFLSLLAFNVIFLIEGCFSDGVPDGDKSNDCGYFTLLRASCKTRFSVDSNVPCENLSKASQPSSSSTDLDRVSGPVDWVVATFDDDDPSATNAAVARGRLEMTACPAESFILTLIIDSDKKRTYQVLAIAETNSPSWFYFDLGLYVGPVLTINISITYVCPNAVWQKLQLFTPRSAPLSRYPKSVLLMSPCNFSEPKPQENICSPPPSTYCNDYSLVLPQARYVVYVRIFWQTKCFSNFLNGVSGVQLTFKDGAMQNIYRNTTPLAPLRTLLDGNGPDFVVLNFPLNVPNAQNMLLSGIPSVLATMGVDHVELFFASSNQTCNQKTTLPVTVDVGLSDAVSSSLNSQTSDLKGNFPVKASNLYPARVSGISRRSSIYSTARSFTTDRKTIANALSTQKLTYAKNTTSIESRSSTEAAAAPTMTPKLQQITSTVTNSKHLATTSDGEASTVAGDYDNSKTTIPLRNSLTSEPSSQGGTNVSVSKQYASITLPLISTTETKRGALVTTTAIRSRSSSNSQKDTASRYAGNLLSSSTIGNAVSTSSTNSTNVLNTSPTEFKDSKSSAESIEQKFLSSNPGDYRTGKATDVSSSTKAFLTPSKTKAQLITTTLIKSTSQLPGSRADKSTNRLTTIPTIKTIYSTSSTFSTELDIKSTSYLHKTTNGLAAISTLTTTKPTSTTDATTTIPEMTTTGPALTTTEATTKLAFTTTHTNSVTAKATTIPAVTTTGPNFTTTKAIAIPAFTTTHSTLTTAEAITIPGTTTMGPTLTTAKSTTSLSLTTTHPTLKTTERATNPAMSTTHSTLTATEATTIHIMTTMSQTLTTNKVTTIPTMTTTHPLFTTTKATTNPTLTTTHPTSKTTEATTIPALTTTHPTTTTTKATTTPTMTTTSPTLTTTEATTNPTLTTTHPTSTTTEATTNLALTTTHSISTTTEATTFPAMTTTSPTLTTTEATTFPAMTTTDPPFTTTEATTIPALTTIHSTLTTTEATTIPTMTTTHPTLTTTEATTIPALTTTHSTSTTTKATTTPTMTTTHSTSTTTEATTNPALTTTHPTSKATEATTNLALTTTHPTSTTSEATTIPALTTVRTILTTTKATTLQALTTTHPTSTTTEATTNPALTTTHPTSKATDTTTFSAVTTIHPTLTTTKATTLPAFTTTHSTSTTTEATTNLAMTTTHPTSTTSEATTIPALTTIRPILATTKATTFPAMTATDPPFTTTEATTFPAMTTTDPPFTTPAATTTQALTTTRTPLTTTEAITTATLTTIHPTLTTNEATTIQTITTTQPTLTTTKATTLPALTTTHPTSTTTEATTFLAMTTNHPTLTTNEATTNLTLATTHPTLTTTKATTNPTLTTTYPTSTTSEATTLPALKTTHSTLITTEATTNPTLTTTHPTLTTTEATTFPAMTTTNPPFTTTEATTIPALTTIHSTLTTTEATTIPTMTTTHHSFTTTEATTISTMTTTSSTLTTTKATTFPAMTTTHPTLTTTEAATNPALTTTGPTMTITKATTSPASTTTHPILTTAEATNPTLTTSHPSLTAETRSEIAYTSTTFVPEFDSSSRKDQSTSKFSAVPAVTTAHNSSSTAGTGFETISNTSYSDPKTTLNSHEDMVTISLTTNLLLTNTSAASTKESFDTLSFISSHSRRQSSPTEQEQQSFNNTAIVPISSSAEEINSVRSSITSFRLSFQSESTADPTSAASSQSVNSNSSESLNTASRLSATHLDTSKSMTSSSIVEQNMTSSDFARNEPASTSILSMPMSRISEPETTTEHVSTLSSTNSTAESMPMLISSISHSIHPEIPVSSKTNVEEIASTKKFNSIDTYMTSNAPSVSSIVSQYQDINRTTVAPDTASTGEEHLETTSLGTKTEVETTTSKPLHRSSSDVESPLPQTSTARSSVAGTRTDDRRSSESSAQTNIHTNQAPTYLSSKPMDSSGGSTTAVSSSRAESSFSSAAAFEGRQTSAPKQMQSTSDVHVALTNNLGTEMSSTDGVESKTSTNIAMRATPSTTTKNRAVNDTITITPELSTISKSVQTQQTWSTGSTDEDTDAISASATEQSVEKTSVMSPATSVPTRAISVSALTEVSDAESRSSGGSSNGESFATRSLSGLLSTTANRQTTSLYSTTNGKMSDKTNSASSEKNADFDDRSTSGETVSKSQATRSWQTRSTEQATQTSMLSTTTILSDAASTGAEGKSTTSATSEALNSATSPSKEGVSSTAEESPLYSTTNAMPLNTSASTVPSHTSVHSSSRDSESPLPQTYTAQSSVGGTSNDAHYSSSTSPSSSSSQIITTNTQHMTSTPLDNNKPDTTDTATSSHPSSSQGGSTPTYVTTSTSLSGQGMRNSSLSQSEISATASSQDSSSSSSSVKASTVHAVTTTSTPIRNTGYDSNTALTISTTKTVNKPNDSPVTGAAAATSTTTGPLTTGVNTIIVWCRFKIINRTFSTHLSNVDTEEYKNLNDTVYTLLWQCLNAVYGHRFIDLRNPLNFSNGSIIVDSRFEIIPPLDNITELNFTLNQTFAEAQPPLTIDPRYFDIGIVGGETTTTAASSPPFDQTIVLMAAILAAILFIVMTSIVVVIVLVVRQRRRNRAAREQLQRDLEDSDETDIISPWPYRRRTNIVWQNQNASLSSLDRQLSSAIGGAASSPGEWRGTQAASVSVHDVLHRNRIDADFLWIGNDNPKPRRRPISRADRTAESSRTRDGGGRSAARPIPRTVRSDVSSASSNSNDHTEIQLGRGGRNVDVPRPYDDRDGTSTRRDRNGPRLSPFVRQRNARSYGPPVFDNLSPFSVPPHWHSSLTEPETAVREPEDERNVTPDTGVSLSASSSSASSGGRGGTGGSDTDRAFLDYSSHDSNPLTLSETGLFLRGNRQRASSVDILHRQSPMYLIDPRNVSLDSNHTQA